MSNRIILAARVVLVLLLSAATDALAQTAYGKNQDKWRWDGRVENGRWMSVHNINGSINFRPSTDNMVHLIAEKRAKPGNYDAREIHFEVVQEGGDVTICAVWHDHGRCELHGYGRDTRSSDENNRTSVDFTVMVPRSVRVGAHSVNGGVSVSDVGAEVGATTVNGGVAVKNVSGPVRASSVNGGVDVGTAMGPVTATTVNGSVKARMSSLSGTDEMRFSTVNGSVTISVPAQFDANIRFDTVHGSIGSDFPITLSGRFGPKHASGTIGKGGREIRVSTVNGGIELRKL